MAGKSEPTETPRLSTSKSDEGRQCLDSNKMAGKREPTEDVGSLMTRNVNALNRMLKKGMDAVDKSGNSKKLRKKNAEEVKGKMKTFKLTKCQLEMCKEIVMGKEK